MPSRQLRGGLPAHGTRRSNDADSYEFATHTLQAVVQKHFPASQFAFYFLGASELLARARLAPQTTYPLTLAENPISSEGQVGFVCLVRLRDFYKFITDDDGTLRRRLFEANVRDYQGRTEVNDEIQKSLQKNSTDDFWWLNNGVSILATKASLGGKVLTIEDPQIVNGLQTSTEVYTYCKTFNPDHDQRKILTRVIVPDERGKPRPDNQGDQQSDSSPTGVAARN